VDKAWSVGYRAGPRSERIIPWDALEFESEDGLPDFRAVLSALADILHSSGGLLGGLSVDRPPKISHCTSLIAVANEMIRLFGHYVSKLYLLLGTVEFCVFFVALLLGYQLGHPAAGAKGAAEVPLLTVGLLYALILSSAVTAMGLYQRTTAEGLPGLVLRLGIAMLLATMALSLLFYTVQPLFFGRKAIGVALLFTFFGVLLIRAVFSRLFGQEANKHRLLVLGTGENAAQIHALEGHLSRFTVVRYVSLGQCVPRVPPELQDELAKEENLLDLAILLDVDEVVVAPDDRQRRLPVDVILDCKMNGFPVLDMMTFFEQETLRINTDLMDPTWLLFADGFSAGPFAQYWKRTLDVLASSILLIPGSLLMLLVGLASLVESRGRHPVLYHQVRVGRHGVPFRLHKFRSMRPDAEHDGVARWASCNDDRVTHLGRFLRKTRLDELPQLINVLRGEMSLVGPRPERPEFVEKLSKEVGCYNERHRVKPGITGWAQLMYQYGSSTEDAKRKLQYDLYYVKNVSPFLDMLILLGTVEVILLGKGAR
jgi:sugar transferase (PEP-CTERM system associated)